MKLLFSLFVSFLLSTPLFCQHRLQFGFEFGRAHTTVRGHDILRNNDVIIEGPGSHYGVYGGISNQYHLSETFSIRSGLAIETKEPSVYGTFTDSISSPEIPFMFDSYVYN